MKYKIGPLLTLISTIALLTGCFSSGESKSLKTITDGSPFNTDRDGKGDELVFRSDKTFDYRLNIKDEYTKLTDVDNGTFALVDSGSYSWQGNWGSHGTSKFYIYQLYDLSYKLERNGGEVTINFYFVDNDGFFYSYIQELTPVAADIKNGLKGTRWFANK